ncbi:MAG: peptidase T, partial [Clostridia bacterium]|nr:peptidase T [Clostridia bacterium]
HAQLRQIEEQFREVAERYGGSVTMEWEQHLKAYRIASNEPVLQRFRAAAKLIGLPVQEQDTFGGSDNNNHVEHGIRGVVPACGMNKTHTVDEYTTLSELTRAAKLTLALMILPEGES